MSKQQKIRREMAQMKMQNYIIKERQTVFIESILILMYCLRNDYNFGQKRVMEFISKFLDNMTDFKLGKYYNKKMLIETLEDELKLNVEEFIKNEVAKTYDRFEKGI